MKTKELKNSTLRTKKTNFSRSEYSKMNMKRANYLFKKQVFATFPECLSYSHKIQQNIDTIETLYKLFSNRLQYFIANKVYNKDTFIISDILSATWEKAINQYYSFNPLKGNILTWLHKIAISVIIDNSRKNKNRNANTLNVSDFVDDEGNEFIQLVSDSQADTIEKDERKIAVHNAINSLPDNYKQIAILFFIKDLSHSKICEILDLPLGTVKSNIYKAKILLQNTLQEVYANS